MLCSLKLHKNSCHSLTHSLSLCSDPVLSLQPIVRTWLGFFTFFSQELFLRVNSKFCFKVLVCQHVIRVCWADLSTGVLMSSLGRGGDVCNYLNSCSLNCMFRFVVSPGRTFWCHLLWSWSLIFFSYTLVGKNGQQQISAWFHWEPYKVWRSGLHIPERCLLEVWGSLLRPHVSCGPDLHWNAWGS